jgi:hypothetical protein
MQLAAVERDLKQSLHPSDYAIYELLKDSDLEQQHVAQFADGIRGYAPIDDGTQTALLLSRLSYRQRYEQLLADAGLNSMRLSTTERDYARKSASQAMEQYLQEVLSSARTLLNDDQYLALDAYERTELARERDRVEIAINAK